MPQSEAAHSGAPHITSAWLGPALALTTAVFWGVLPLGLKQVLEVLDPWTITFYRFATAALCLLGWQLYNGQIRAFSTLSASQWQKLLLCGLFLCANYASYLSGLNHLDAATAQVMIQLAPLLLLLGSVVWFKEAFSGAQMLGVVVLVSGFALFFNRNLAVLFSELGQYTLGVLLIILGAVTWAAYALIQKTLNGALSPVNIMLVLYSTGALVFWPAADPLSVAGISGWHWLMLAFSCANTLIAYGAFAEALVRWQASKVSAVLALTPLVTLLLMDTLLWAGLEVTGRMQTNGWVYLGALGVVYGSILTTLGRRALPSRQTALILKRPAADKG